MDVLLALGVRPLALALQAGQFLLNLATLRSVRLFPLVLYGLGFAPNPVDLAWRNVVLEAVFFRVVRHDAVGLGAFL